MARATRRDFLKACGAAGAGLAAVPAAASTAPGGGFAREDSLGLLYDATKCVGCKACVSACKRVNAMGATRAAFDAQGVWDAPQDLDGNTRNIIKLYKGENRTSFVKQQCMHCAKPSCVSACPVSAMQRDDQGRIFYDKSRCIGCRYCQVACPFNVPRFQWDRAVPQIVKCDLCKFTDAATRGSPACAGTCPTGAVAYGRRGDLLREAWARIEGSPDTYRRQVYGENEVGGTNVLYLASVPFDRLGFPNLPDRAPAAFSEKIQHTIYKGFLTPIALYAALFGVAVGHRRRRERKGGD